MEIHLLEATSFDGGDLVVRAFYDKEAARNAALEYLDFYDVEFREIKVEENPRLYAFLIAWNDNDTEEGEYGWVGEADGRDEALAMAYESMWTENAVPDEDDPFDLNNYRVGRRVIEEWHGRNPWQ